MTVNKTREMPYFTSRWLNLDKFILIPLMIIGLLRYTVQYDGFDYSLTGKYETFFQYILLLVLIALVSLDWRPILSMTLLRQPRTTSSLESIMAMSSTHCFPQLDSISLYPLSCSSNPLSWNTLSMFTTYAIWYPVHLLAIHPNHYSSSIERKKTAQLLFGCYHLPYWWTWHLRICWEPCNWQ